VIQPDKTLLLFTAAFPYGKSETFLETELPYLVEAFSKIIIIHNEIGDHKRAVPPTVELVHFPYNLSSQEKKKAVKTVLNSLFWKEIFRLHFRYHRLLNRGIFATITLSLFKEKKLSLFLESLFKQKALSKTETLLYSYWCNDIAFAIAQFKKRNPTVKAISRAHGWDVYFEVSQFNYLPFRKEVLQNLDYVSFIADFGKEYTKKMNPDVPECKMKLSRLGVHNVLQTEWKNPLSEEGVFRIVSCSNLIPLKRVGLLVESLAEILKETKSKPVEWIHFGDGVEMAKVGALAKQHLERKMNYELKGRVTNQALLQYYHQNKVDLFVNLSTSEGVPVSIMEAMSFGVPVLATNVGGVSEIVNNGNGMLLSPNPTAKEVAQQLLQFIHSSDSKRLEKSKHAWETWNEQYNAEKNYKRFISMLR